MRQVVEWQPENAYEPLQDADTWRCHDAQKRAVTVVKIEELK